MAYIRPISVQSYKEAQDWLWANARPHEWLDDPDHIPLLAHFVCDMFWISPAQLLKDLRKTWRETLFLTQPRAHQRTQHGWYR